MAMPAPFPELLALYETELLQRCVPFWLRHAVDWEHGGLLTCLRDDGTVISTDKYLWSQLRALWTFSALYNRVQPDPVFLRVADNLCRFVLAHGRDAEGRWVFHLDRAGNIVEGATSIYADGFAIYGLTEYARATGNEQAIGAALETYESVRARLAVPGSYQTAPYQIPDGAIAHGIAMIFSHVFDELGVYLGDQAIRAEAETLADQVMELFRHPEQRLLFEYVAPDGTLLDGPEGRVVNPGHTIESMWFMIHLYRDRGFATRVDQAVETIGWALEAGWDAEYGGIYHAIDPTGEPPAWPFPQAKLWWPHTEALYALLLAYECSGETWCLEWYDRVHDYAFTHFPDREHGEWRQRLDRQGQPITDVVALPVKDPFHLPRALIYSRDVLRRLAEE